MQPTAPRRYKVQFTASEEVHDKLERLQELMQGDLATVIEQAVTEKLERLESKRFGKTKAPRKSVQEADTTASSRHIPAPVKRAVRERDGNRCTFVDKAGRRCTAKRRLEFHHRRPFAHGGDHSPDNIALMCPAHNTYFAERDYGRQFMRHHRRQPDRVSEPGALYGLAV